MFLERFFVEGLAHASYLFGGEGEAAVVDPRRDVDEYIAAAEQRSARIVAILETHPHADFVSGHMELAERTGATIYVSNKAPVQYPSHGVKHGEEISVGSVRVKALETFGHSPDSLSFYAESDGELLVFTGDTLFVGDVGRPDLRDAHADPREMAEALYNSIREVLLQLPPETVVYPAHGAGSLCGRRIGAAPTTTIGAERAQNWANQFASREEFVAAMLSHLPDRPAYFAHDVMTNLVGARPLAQVPQPGLLVPAALRDLPPDALVVDTRGPEVYGAGHLAGSLNVGIGSPLFSTWTGFFVAPTAPLVLIVERPEEVEEARLQLARIGYEKITGYVVADAEAWHAAGLDLRTTPQMDVCCLEAWLQNGNRLLDLRTPSEWEAGHVPGARWIPLPALPARISEVPEQPLALMCGSGYRSSLATSLLERAGLAGVTNVTGGWSAWNTRACPEPDALDLFCRAPGHAASAGRSA